MTTLMIVYGILLFVAGYLVSLITSGRWYYRQGFNFGMLWSEPDKLDPVLVAETEKWLAKREAKRKQRVPTVRERLEADGIFQAQLKAQDENISQG